MKKHILLTLCNLLLLLPSARAFDHTESIKLDSSDLPANDLVSPSFLNPSGILNPEQAWDLAHNHKVDLSTLDPDTTTDIWRAKPTLSVQRFELGSDPAGDYQGTLQSKEGDLRFTIQVNQPHPQMLTVLLSKTAHSVLLRQALLQRLGYVIPQMEHLQKLTVRFKDVASKRMLTKNEITSETYGAPSRWIPRAEDIDGERLSVTFQDVIVMSARQDIYNLAVAAPVNLNANNEIRPLANRTLRSLLVSYALVDLGESVNQFDWTVGLSQNNSIRIPANQPENFSCTLDDARWIIKRIAKFSRDDFAHIVQEAKLPSAVAALMIEKIISRRNHLLKLFSVESAALAFDSKLSLPPDLQGGKIITQTWPGYASRFAYGDPESPIHDLKFFGASELQSNGITNLISLANSQIPNLSVNDGVAAHGTSLQNLYEQKLIEYILYGNPVHLPMKAWTAPLVSGNAILSRDVVIGSYLGTNNLIQLADTLGMSASAGIFIGLDALPAYASVHAQATGSVSVTYTHLQPLSSMKQALKEPIKNMMVPWLNLSSAKKLRELANLQNSGLEPGERRKEIATLLEQIKNSLSVGDSLIMSLTLAANENVSGTAGLSTPLTPSVTAEAGLRQMTLSRVHIYRKSAEVIQVFKDRGELGGIQLAAQFSVGAGISFPVLSVSLSDTHGKADIKYFELNLDSDPERNPRIFANASGLSALLKTGSTETLTESSPPYELKIHFKDSSSAFSFFHWRRRSLNADGIYEAKAPDGRTSKFIYLSEGSQTGKHYQSLATDAASYLAERLTNGAGQIQSQSAQDPGQSFLGDSQTRQVSFQSRLDEGVAAPMVRISHRWQGWSLSHDRAQDILNSLDQTYGFSFYPKEVFNQMKTIKLYDISTGLDLHEKGLLRFAQMPKENEKNLIKKYNQRYTCDRYWNDLQHSTAEQIKVCPAIDKYDAAFKKFQSFGANPAQENAKAIANSLFTLGAKAELFLPFAELAALVGPENYYLYSSITGYREGIENISDPIQSSTLGQAQGPQSQGPVDQLQSILGIETGEFNANWIREVL